MTEPDRDDLVECNGPHCTARIRWVITIGGKRMPIDPDPHPDGRVVPVRLDGRIRARVLTGSDDIPDGPLYRAHWASCPDSAEFKRLQRATAPKCRGCLEALDPALAAAGDRYHPTCAPSDFREHVDRHRPTPTDTGQEALPL